MKITDVKVQIIKRELKLPDGTDLKREGESFLDRFAHVPVLTIITDEGIHGTSFGRDGLEIAQHLAKVKSFLVGKKPLCIEKLWQESWSRSREWFLPQIILGMIDVALWDILGKKANLPVYKLLGAYRDKIKSYASLPVIDTPEQTVEEVLKYVEKGFSAFKLHTPGDISIDIAICKAVRKAVGDKIALMLDPIGAYDYNGAMRVGKVIEELNYHWYEEPVSDTNINSYVKLCSKLDIPLCSQSSLPGNLFSRAERILRGATDILRGDVLYSEGISSLKKTASLADAFGMNCEIHGLFDPVMNAANLHVMCSIKNSEYYEYIAVEQLQNWGVTDGGVRIDDKGFAHVPQKPGIGIDIDWEYINKHTVLVC